MSFSLFGYCCAWWLLLLHVVVLIICLKVIEKEEFFDLLLLLLLLLLLQLIRAFKSNSCAAVVKRLNCQFWLKVFFFSHIPSEFFFSLAKKKNMENVCQTHTLTNKHVIHTLIRIEWHMNCF